MKPSLQLSREAWLKALGTGQLDLGVAFPTLATYGLPGAPWEHRRRTLDAGIMYLLVNGGIRARLPNATWDLTEGSLFLLGPGVQHDLELLSSDRPITVYHLRLHPLLGEKSCWLRDKALCFRHVLSLRPYLESILDESGTDLPWSKERIHALFFLIFSAVFRIKDGEKLSGLTLSQQTRLARYVRTHITGHPSPADLAAELGLSPIYFSRRFKAAYGTIPRVWLLRERLRIASLQLAESGKSIRQVAEDLGYQNAALFSRQFAREFGQSPRAFRQRHHHHGPTRAT